MKKYWFRIAASSLGIFVIGMLLVAAGRRGVSRVRELVTNQSVTLPANSAPFEVDGRRYGSLTHINLRDTEGTPLPSIQFTVLLDDPFDWEDLADCALTVEDVAALERQRGLHCGSATATGPDSLLILGSVKFEPGGQQLDLYVPAHELAGLKSLEPPSHQSLVHPATVDRSSIDLQADSQGAFMLIRDKNGNPIFHLNADSEGAFLQVRDGSGREVLRFRADSAGVVGRIKPD